MKGHFSSFSPLVLFHLEQKIFFLKQTLPCYLYSMESDSMEKSFLMISCKVLFCLDQVKVFLLCLILLPWFLEQA